MSDHAGRTHLVRRKSSNLTRNGLVYAQYGDVVVPRTPFPGVPRVYLVAHDVRRRAFTRREVHLRCDKPEAVVKTVDVVQAVSGGEEVAWRDLHRPAREQFALYFDEQLSEERVGALRHGLPKYDFPFRRPAGETGRKNKEERARRAGTHEVRFSAVRGR